MFTEYLNSSKDTKRYEKTTRISQRAGTYFIRPLLSFIHSERITLQRRSDLVCRGESSERFIVNAV